MKNGLRAAVMAAVLLVGLVGCSLGPTKAGPPHRYNGEVLSRTAVQVVGQTASTLDQLFYWCAGHRVQAYVNMPAGKGKVSLLVRLHGGAAWNTSHSSFGWTSAQAFAFSSSTPGVAVLFPEYQGYLGSGGSVQGLYTDAQDTICAIHAVEATGRIARSGLYLIGTSIGGGVALKVASELAGVRAVVAISPWVGLRIAEPWQEKNARVGTIFFHELSAEIASYGRHPSAATLARQSPAIATITAPVLLLQGTGDHHVAWQTVQEFYQAMKADGKTVKLILYPGGHHGLQGQYAAQAAVAAFSWLDRY